MGKINLTNLSHQTQKLLLSSFHMYLHQQNAKVLRQYLTVMGIKKYIVGSNKTYLTKNQTLKAIIERLEIDEKLRMEILQKQFENIYQEVLSQQQKLAIEEQLGPLLIQQNKLPQNLRQKMVIPQYKPSKYSRKSNILSSLQNMKKHKQKTLLNFIQSIKVEMQQEQVKQKQLQSGSTQRINRKPFQGVQSRYMLENNMMSYTQFLNRPVALLTAYNIESYPIMPDFMRTKPTLYSIPIEQLKLSIPNQQMSRFNHVIDEYILKWPQSSRRNLKKLLFQYTGIFHEHKIGKNSIKNTIEAIKTLNIIKYIEVNKKSHIPQIEEISRISELVEELKAVDDQQQQQHQDAQHGKSEMQSIKEIFNNIGTFIKSNNNIEKKHQQFTKLSTAIVRLINTTTGYIRIFIEQLKQETIRLVQLLDSKSAKTWHHSQLIWVLNFYCQIYFEIGGKVEKDCTEGLGIVVENLCQLILLICSNFNLELQKYQQIASRFVNTHYFLQNMEFLHRIIQKPLHGSPQINLQEIYETSEYQQILNAIHSLLGRLFREPTIQNYELLTQEYGLTFQYDISVIYSIIKSCSQMILSEDIEGSPKIIIGMVYQVGKYMYSSQKYHSKYDVGMFRCLTQLLVKFKDPILTTINESFPDKMEREIVKRSIALMLNKIIIDYLSLTEHSTKNMIQIFDLMVSYDCFVHIKSNSEGISSSQFSGSDDLIEFMMVSCLDLEALQEPKSISEKLKSFILSIINRYIKEQQSRDRLVNMVTKTMV